MAGVAPDSQADGVLGRRFEAAIFDWDGTAVPDRGASALRVRRLVEALSAAGFDIGIVSGTHVDNVDGQLAARPTGPGRLLLALNRGSEIYEVGPRGPRLLDRRVATDDEERALTAGGRAHGRGPGRARPPGGDRRQPPQPPEDRPDPGAGLGRSSQGSHRRAGRGGRGAAGRCRHRRPARCRSARARGGSSVRPA